MELTVPEIEGPQQLHLHPLEKNSQFIISQKNYIKRSHTLYMKL